MRDLRWVVAVSLVQLISFTLICAAQALAPSTQPVDLFGKVVGPDNKPVLGAQVSLVEYNAETRGYSTSATTTTDAQGKFQFTTKSPTVLAVVHAPRFGLAGAVLQDSSADLPAEIRLKAPTELHLKFIGPDGNPVAGMKVVPNYLREQVQSLASSTVMFADAIKDEFTRTTDASGVCTIPGLPQGSMFLFDIGDDHFASQNNVTNIRLATAPTTDGGTIQLELAGSISGKVTAADSGKPIAKLTVMAQGQATNSNGEQPGWIVNTQTDADGKYTLKKAKGGTYTMRFEMTPELTAQYAAPANESFALTAGQDIAGKDIALVSGGIITGKVTKAGSGDPVPNVRIYALSIDNTRRTVASQSNTLTGVDGTYVMHVTPGQQQISISGVPNEFMMPRNQIRPTNVADGQSFTADFQLSPNPNPPLKGHVVDEKGEPVSGASVVLENAPDPQNPGPRNSQSQTDKDGAFTVPGVAESTSVRARKGTTATLAPMFVTAQNRNDMKITLHKDAVASVRIKLVDTAGQPIADGQLMVLQMVSGNSRIGMQGGITEADGTEVVPSLYLDTNYSVQAQAKGYGSGSVNLSLRPGATVDVPLTLIKADSFVAGMVLDENQLPLANTDVYATGPKSNQQTAKTDFTGHFRIDNIVPGDSLTVYTRAGNRIAQQPPDRVPAGTDNMILIHNPAPPPAPSTRGVRAR